VLIFTIEYAARLWTAVEVPFLARSVEGALEMGFAAGSVQRKPSPSEEVFKTGDVFGIGAMLEGEPSRGAVVTTSRCRLLKLFREDFHRLETANPAIAGVGRAAASKRGPNRATPAGA
jgi:CRP-like cAMP-binding protein